MLDRRIVLLALSLNVACADGESFGRRDAGGPGTDSGARLDAGTMLDGGLDAPSAPDAPASSIDAPSPSADTPSGTDAPSPTMDAPVAAVDAPAGTADAPASTPDAPVPFDAGRDGGTTAPPGPGSYVYTRSAIGGLQEAVVVAFAADGSYALVLERSTGVHVYDWATRTSTRIDVRVGGRAVYLEDVAFDPGGQFALIAGYEIVAGAETGILIEVSDAMIRGGMASAAFTRLAELRAGERFTAIEYPGPGEGAAGDGRPFVLSSTRLSTAYIYRLRELDVVTRTFAGLVEARNSSAGCDDIAFADNEFGGWGVVVVCGVNGADVPYYTVVGGVGEWRPLVGATPGNTSRIASHGTGDYALAISNSGRRVHRFQAGAWMTFGSSPWFTTQGIYDVSFSPDGRRALVVGNSGATPLRGTVLEYRHDLYSFAAITDVSIPNFAMPPYNATTSTILNDSAFRPGCDGGLVVGGSSGVSGSVGMIIEFQIEGGAACR